MNDIPLSLNTPVSEVPSTLTGSIDVKSHAPIAVESIVRIAVMEDKQSFIDLWRLCFEDTEDFIAWFFENRFFPEYSVCVEIDGILVSAMQSMPLPLSIRGKSIPGAIVVGVCTHPDFRGQGIMKKMFPFYMEQMLHKDIIAVTYKPENLKTYFSLGHYPVTRTLRYEESSLTRESSERKDVSKTEKPSVAKESTESKENSVQLPIIPPCNYPFPGFDDISILDASGFLLEKGSIHPVLMDCLALYQSVMEGYSGFVDRNADLFDMKARDYASVGGRLLLYHTACSKGIPTTCSSSSAAADDDAANTTIPITTYNYTATDDDAAYDAFSAVAADAVATNAVAPSSSALSYASSLLSSRSIQSESLHKKKLAGYCFYFDTPEEIYGEELIAFDYASMISMVSQLRCIADGRSIRVKLAPFYDDSHADDSLANEKPIPELTKLSYFQFSSWSSHLKIAPQNVMGVTDIGRFVQFMNLERFANKELLQALSIEIIDPVINRNSVLLDLSGSITEKPPCISIPVGSFVQMLCGYLTLDDLVKTDSLPLVIHDKEKAVQINNLLPLCLCFIVDEY